MGREALVAALCCFVVSSTQANSFVLRDQLGAESARLYRHAPGLVYASAAPYGAYSFQIPTVSAPQGAASRIVPIKESHNVQHANGNGYLKDSYGNQFVEALQSMKSLPFRPFPQQFVQLQELPAHLVQPLAASFHRQQYKQAPQAFTSPYRVQQVAAAPAPLNQHYTYATTNAGYADALKNLSPASISYGPHFGSVIHVPVQSVAPTREAPKSVQSTQDSTHSLSENQEQRSAPLQSSYRPGFIEQSQEQGHHLPGEHRFQRLQEAPRASYSEEEAPVPQVKPKPSTHELVSAVKDVPISTVVNGKKTVVNVETKPPLPLLDINLLEPLTFANPLVPQVQHFLPRINEATYHKLPELEKHEDKKYQKEIRVQKTKSYDSGVIKGKPKKPKKKQKAPPSHHSNDDEYIPAATARPSVSVTKALEEAPEIIYEINLPNHKETIKEKSVSYNKETNSAPVHYSYGTNTHKEPVQYSYTHSSKEPVHIQEVRYEGNGEGPKHLIYHSKPDEHIGESEKSKPAAEDSGESAEHSEDEVPPRKQHGRHKEHHSTHEAPNTSHHYVPEHREQEYHHRPNGYHYNEQNAEHEHRNRPSSDSHHAQPEYHHKPSSRGHQNVHHSEHEHHHKPNSDGNQNVHHNERDHHYKPNSGGHQNVHHNNEHENHHVPSSDGHQDVQHRDQEYHHKPHPDAHHNVQHSSNPHQYPALEVAPHQYEEDISFTAPIKVDPSQHVQRERPEQPRSSPAPQQHSRPSHAPRHHQQSDSNPHHEAPITHVHEKTKQVYTKEETPEDEDTAGEQLMKKIFGKQEDTEQDFENAYKNAAFGFPAYDNRQVDVEKDIYNPESYGVPRDHSSYDIDHAPFQQYHDHGDDFPKQMRLSYKDDRDKTKEDYFLDYSISKPESLIDRHKNKVSYYKLYKDQKPEKYVAHEDDKKQKSAKLTAIPYSYYPVPGDNMKQLLEQYKVVAAPYVFEYDYSKGFSPVPAKPGQFPKDSSAHASRPLQRYKMTQFVEPQFQYGFEPIGIPRLLDSELAAMASNHSPEGEKPATRKKIYKENFYIKKTSMSDASPNS